MFLIVFYDNLKNNYINKIIKKNKVKTIWNSQTIFFFYTILKNNLKTLFLKTIFGIVFENDHWTRLRLWCMVTN